MNRSNFSKDKRVSRQASVAAGILFCVFSFLFLTQGFDEQLEIVGSEYSHVLSLRIPVSLWVIALLMVALLQGIQVCIKSVFRLETRFLILSYLPSYAGLLFLVWMGGGAFDVQMMYLSHLFLGGFFVLLLVVWVIKYLLVGSDSRYTLRDPISNYPVWRMCNLFLFALCMFAVGMLSPMKQSVRNEAAMMQAVQANELSRVLEIDKSNQYPSKRMTQLRNRALLQAGMLGESLFEYPQNYGMMGLDQEFLRETDQVSKEYELRMARLLLDKKLEEFMKELSNYAQFFSRKEFPKHYLEAYAYYVYQHPEKPYLIQNADLRTRFVSYLKERDKYSDTETQRKALSGTDFRGTYWWYYEYVTPENSTN